MDFKCVPWCCLSLLAWLSQCSATECMPCSQDVGYQFVAPLGPGCTHVTSGCKSDGFGAQMQAHMSIWAYAQVSGMRYVHLPVSWATGTGPEELLALEEYFNLGHMEMSLAQAQDKNVTLCVAKHCYDHMDSRPADWEGLRTKLRNKQRGSVKPAFPGLPGKLSIAIHIRRGDVSALTEGPLDRFSPESYFIFVLNELREGIPSSWRDELDVMVVSQPVANMTAEEQFPGLAKYPEVRFLLNQTTMQAMHTLVAADVLVMSHSSFSFVAGLLNPGIVIYNAFWHSRLPTWFEHPAHASLAARMMLRRHRLQRAIRGAGREYTVAKHHA